MLENIGERPLLILFGKKSTSYWQNALRKRQNMIDYNLVNTQLIYAGADVWASESHGFQCGSWISPTG